MFDFFQYVLDFISTVVTFISNFFSALTQGVVLVSNSLTFLALLPGYFPGVLGGLLVSSCDRIVWY